MLNDLRRLGIGFTLAMGAFALASLAAASQVWFYPYPRSLFLDLAMGTALAAACFLIATAVEATAISLAVWWARVGLYVASAAVMLLGFAVIFRAIGPLVALFDCRYQNSLCDTTVQGMTPEARESLYKALAESRHWRPW